MKSPEDFQRDYYNRTATLYDNMHIKQEDEHFVALKYISAFIDMIGIKSILDVGCGTGRGVKWFLEKHSIQVHGIEPVPALINQAIKKGIPSDLISLGNGYSIPFRDHSFDAVCELGILHHVKSPEMVVKEMIRVSKKAIFLSDSNRFGQGNIINRWIKLILYKMNIFHIADLLKTKGKGYSISEADGLAYSYSIYDQFNLLAQWADRLIIIPTKKEPISTWIYPLLSSSHVVVCAFKD